MAVVQLSGRLRARWRAGKLLQEGLRLTAGMELDRSQAVLGEAFASARESRVDALVVETGEELYQVLLRRRHLEEAVPVAAELVACHGRRTGAAGEPARAWRNELIRLLGRIGRFPEAEPHCRQRLDEARRRRPADARSVAFALVTLGWCLREQRRRDEAEDVYREAVALLDGASQGAVAWARAGLAAVLLRRMALDDAEAALRGAIEEWNRVGRGELAVAAEEQLMDLYVVGERHGDALALSEAALQRARRGAAAMAGPESHLRTLDRHAFLLRACGRDADAARYELRAGYLRGSLESERRPSSVDEADPTGPVFEGEPLLDWELPGAPIPARAC